MRIALAGAGAFGEKHLDGLKNIDGVTVTSLVGRELEPTRAINTVSATSLQNSMKRLPATTSMRSFYARLRRCTLSKLLPAWRQASMSR